MRFIMTTLIFLTAGLATAEDFTSKEAKTAKAEYETNLETAREKYKQALGEAAQAAITAGDTDELARITNTIQNLEGKKTIDVKRVLWKHKGGYFEKLNDGYWIERVSNGDANIFSQADANDDYIEISRHKTIVRLYKTKSTVLFASKRGGFKTLHSSGDWIQE